MKKHYTILFTLILILVATAVSPGQSAAAPQQQTNLLQNPGFEPPYDDKGAAGSWVRWHRESSPDKFGDCLNGYHKKPRWGNAIDVFKDGATSQYIGNNWDTWSAGMWQNVKVTPGARYRFSFYARGRGAMEGAPAPSYVGLRMNIRAGIDPNGSGLWNDADVVWSAAGDAHDQWVQFSIEATAATDTITVFTSADWAVPGVNQCYKFLDTYYDSAQLIELGPPPTNTPLPPPPATNTPLPPTVTPTPLFTATPLPTPTETPSPTPEPPKGGRVCVNAFDDRNANGVHDADEGYMAGITFQVANTETMIGQAISAGTADPYCFEEVLPGSYQVVQLLPGRLEMTTASAAAINVEVGKTVGLEFGSRLVLPGMSSTDTSSPDTVSSESATAVADASTNVTPASETTATATNDGPGLGSYLGLGVLVVGVILLGGLLFMLLRRQTG